MIPLLDLNAHTCSWPILGAGETIQFCGAQTRENSSYCPTHHAVAYLPPREARREKRVLDTIARRAPRMTSFPRMDAAE